MDWPDTVEGQEDALQRLLRRLMQYYRHMQCSPVQSSRHCMFMFT